MTIPVLVSPEFITDRADARAAGGLLEFGRSSKLLIIILQSIVCRFKCDYVC